MPQQNSLTQQVTQFIENIQYADLPQESIGIASRCMLDTFGLYVTGATEPSVRILVEDAQATGGRPDATLLSGGGNKVPAGLAARVLGTAGHSQDWDDTQVSLDPKHRYGMLTHPSVPPFTAALVIAQYLGGISGKQLMLAFQTGFEVECKISECMLPDHYRRGHHSSGTVGTFGACAAAAKLLGLKGEKLANAIGIATSLAAGVRCNFGTMTKPLHVGRAAENGITAAFLAQRGFTADPASLDGPWGFMQVLGGGHTPEKVAAGLGKPLTIVSPGVSIKPYPSGILTHQAMDALLELVLEHDLKPDQIRKIKFYAASNILEPIRYTLAKNHLQAKFSMQALLAMIVLRRHAGPHEFTDEFVGGAEMQNMQQRIETIHDPEIEAQGFEWIRSRFILETTDGRTLEKEADKRYRGGPSKPMTNAEVEDKFRICTDGLLNPQKQKDIVAAIWSIGTLEDSSMLLDMLGKIATTDSNGAHK
ncbi:MAG TPA: MmgE/PrpD family protein [Paralcaligenes sp.]